MTTKTKKQLEIRAEPGKQESFIIREFDAPRELVFRAFAEPDLLVQWVGPDDLEMTIDYYDSRSGGSYRYIHTDKQGNSYAFRGVIHEVSSPDLIIQTFEFEGLPGKGNVCLDIHLFEALPGNRTRVTIQSLFRTVGDRDGMLQSGMETGVNEGYAKLDAILLDLQ